MLKRWGRTKSALVKDFHNIRMNRGRRQQQLGNLSFLLLLLPTWFSLSSKSRQSESKALTEAEADWLTPSWKEKEMSLASRSHDGILPRNVLTPFATEKRGKSETFFFLTPTKNEANIFPSGVANFPIVSRTNQDASIKLDSKQRGAEISGSGFSVFIQRQWKRKKERKLLGVKNRLANKHKRPKETTE